MLTQKDGEAIARKLGITPKEGRGHAKVHVRIDGVWVGSFNIRRGSRDCNHDYIAKQMHLPYHDCAEFAACRKNVDWYRQVLKGKGLL